MKASAVPFVMILLIIQLINSHAINTQPIINGYNLNEQSFHENTSLYNANWFALKFYSPSPFNVTEMHLKFFYECKECRIDWCGYVITNLTHSIRGGIITEFVDKDESFFHIKIGSFNYTYNNLATYNISVPGAEIWKRNFTLSQGIWYLICFAGETIKSRIEVDFNTSNNVKLIGTEEGNGTHILLPEDFLGNLNIKLGYRGVIVLNGKKTISINNTLVGIHYSMFEYNCQGFEDFQYVTPSSEKEEFVIFSIFNHKIILKDFPYKVILGGSGKWNFRLNLFMVGKRLPSGEYFSPGFGIGLIYADVKLP